MKGEEVGAKRDEDEEMRLVPRLDQSFFDLAAVLLISRKNNKPGEERFPFHGDAVGFLSS